jgi:mono/diheme cytochrome c family protein
MKMRAKIVSWMLLGSWTVFALSLPAQSKPSSSSAASSALSEDQEAGKALFMQNCSLCHLPHKENSKSATEGFAIGTVLKGLFRGEKPRSEQTVRTFIMRGVPQKMPGFQYSLERKEIDNIISYLKTL